ncbi:GNAT family N-acetyltransferase [Prolixibacteraceae bacterium Z1-6]|uniref:GNAT family N-acetyltransferase n=1 Tax=Draconibacterium aestuarii TaxID=2998507 RepID=A0A9X3FHQ7_9BACT|nr:GNAT family N-acetyltransferase [Prolixibacteraceae bacterium Z1-6]
MIVDGVRYHTFETERLFIRPCVLDDAEFIFKLLNCESWLKYIGNRNVKSVEEACNYIKTKMYPQLKRLGFGNYTVIRKSDNTKLGTCGLNDREGLEGIDIGFAFLPQYEGQGYAFESAQKLKTAGFDLFLLTEITGITRPDNLPSRKLLEKIGLHFDKCILLPNDQEKLMFYRLENNKKN